MNILLEALADVEHLPALAGLDLLALVLHLAFGTLDLSARRTCLFVLTLLRSESSSRAKLVSSGLDQLSDRRHYFYRRFTKIERIGRPSRRGLWRRRLSPFAPSWAPVRPLDPRVSDGRRQYRATSSSRPSRPMNEGRAIQNRVCVAEWNE